MWGRHSPHHTARASVPASVKWGYHEDWMGLGRMSIAVCPGSPALLLLYPQRGLPLPGGAALSQASGLGFGPRSVTSPFSTLEMLLLHLGNGKIFFLGRGSWGVLFPSPEKCISVCAPISGAHRHTVNLSIKPRTRCGGQQGSAPHPVPSPSCCSLCRHHTPTLPAPLSFQDALKPGTVPLQGAHASACRWRSAWSPPLLHSWPRGA